MTDEQPERRYSPHAIHLVRTGQQIQVQLSAMADHKASILMGATFVVFTIAINQARNDTLGNPMLVLGCFSFAAALLAVMAIIPAVKTRPGAPLNLIFFGSFTQLDEEDYIDRVAAQLESDDLLLRAMARDMYQNGMVLRHKKYRYLGYAYRVFLIGLVATFATFLAERFL
ncbi:MAG: hypothetical protein ABS87_12100 [Sphingomonas sp. SCN 67-18]|uniref:Pycsar system effector family protein n=1 Tax=uncultured Sphingomonas sp. TaxID=158754 RepID=UPI00086E3ABD|nr:Pycsar system effector family protein [Sphingomonas sp. SCN 67-18]ODU20044.1 MAG: hypothetical protein ABS87_12100 [Sphingomonas sp. SCN 67-18]